MLEKVPWCFECDSKMYQKETAFQDVETDVFSQNKFCVFNIDSQIFYVVSSGSGWLSTE
jgi:hypothetical protein